MYCICSYLLHKIFRVFNFRRKRSSMKYFNDKIFTIYGILQSFFSSRLLSAKLLYLSRMHPQHYGPQILQDCSHFPLQLHQTSHSHGQRQWTDYRQLCWGLSEWRSLKRKQFQFGKANVLMNLVPCIHINNISRFLSIDASFIKGGPWRCPCLVWFRVPYWKWYWVVIQLEEMVFLDKD